MAGVLYLLVGVLSAPVILWVRPSVRVAGDAAATAQAVAAGERLMRAGFVADLVHLVSFILLALVLRVLLRHVHAHAAAAMVTFVALAVGIMSLNLVNHMAAVVVATGSVATTGAAAVGDAHRGGAGGGPRRARRADRGRAVAPVLDRTYPLAEAAEAMRRLESGQVRGKVAITV